MFKCILYERHATIYEGAGGRIPIPEELSLRLFVQPCQPSSQVASGMTLFTTARPFPDMHI